MRKHLIKFLRAALATVIGIVLLFCLSFAAMQTKWVKKQLQDKLSSIAKEAGIKMSMGPIEGNLLFNWTIRDLHIELTPKDTFDVEKLHMRIAFLPLLRKEISISYLSLSQARILFSQETTTLPPLSHFVLPFSVSIKALKADDLLIQKFETKEKELFSLRAFGKLKKRAQEFLVDLKLLSPEDSSSSFEFFLKGSQKTQTIDTALQVRLKSTQALRPFFSLPFETECLMEARLEGPWETWKALYLGTGEGPPLKGSLEARTSKWEMPGFKWLNRKWNLSSNFTLAADHSSTFSNVSLNSNLLHLDAAASLNPHFELEQGSATLVLPQLSLLSLYLLPLQGSLHAEAKYAGSQTHLEITTKELQIGNQKYENLTGSFHADLENGIWKGSGDFLAQNRRLPIESSLTLFLEPHYRLSIKDFEIKAPDTEIAGFLNLDISQKQMEGSLFAYLRDLSRFQEWTLPHSGLSGNAALEMQLHGHSAQIHCVLNQLLYRDIHAQKAAAHLEFLDVFHPTSGFIFSLDGENFSQPSFELAVFDLKTTWDGKQGPYELFAQGTWKEPLLIESQGFWSSDSLNIDKLQGVLLRQGFSLQHPCSLTKTKESLQVSQCDIHLGSGYVSLGLNLSRAFSEGHFKARHFPLDLFLISHPSFSCSGTTSIDTYFKGDENNIQGRINLVLEELDIYQCGKTCPLKIKGTLEAHLDQKTLQIETDLKGSNEQFLEYKSTLPIDYTLFPLKVEIDKARPLSGELAFEGRLEEIFDFINIGSHRLSGLLSGNLILSKTLYNPSLRGELLFSQGNYENYYTGTLLKEIAAKIEADGESVQLSTFEAKDDQGGKVTAQGKLNLQYKEKYPYSITADLSNLKLLRFDAGTSNFTGTMLIHGNTQSALAQGSITVPKAEFSIPDEMPPDLPVLPVTYINRPPHLDPFTIQPLPVFPFQLDLNLTAPGPIYVRGRGLRSEWKGEAHVGGTNTDIAANGQLLLTKGEFIFSGKVFSLTEGEITLTDKPSQGAFLKLRGEASLPEATITALLNGPFSAPILTFQSIPSMPTSSILSLILFNKDIAEISPFQAIQIAQTLVSLSGGAGPDVLEKIRKSIGVDRLNIVSSPNTDEVSVQIGKYLIKGVMITLTQGLDSSQIVVEVELRHGFVLQAETQEEEEGKFSLKWNRNY